MDHLSILKSYSHKKILITGGSGFLGKVWVVLLLDRVPNLGKLYILIRRNGHDSAQSRFEKMVSTSFVFKPLHDKYGDSLSEFLSKHVEVIDGDATEPHLGIPTEKVEQLHSELDLIVNFAGLVDFNPDVRDALATNVNGALNVAEFSAQCEKAALLHISTCYVAGTRQGTISEKIESLAPNGSAFDAEKEVEELKKSIQSIELKNENQELDESLKNRVHAKTHRNQSNGKQDTREQNVLRLLKRKQLRQAMIQHGMDSARSLGWTNTYTYSKALAEQLIQRRYRNLRFSVFRPSIVESAVNYPFPGWNEGFNTSGPLAYLIGTWFRYLPLKKGNPFDVIPVDIVCKGLTIAGAALLTNQSKEVYQCGTSHHNLFTIDRACELTSLGHRIFLRKHGATRTERLILSRWDTVPADENHLFSIPNLLSVLNATHRMIQKVESLFGVKFKKANDFFVRTSRKLNQIREMLDLFKPFIHDNRWIFECNHLKEHSVVEDEFQFKPESFSWREYWLYTHMPGLRRWCFPSIEGKEIEKLQPQTPVRLQSDRQLPPTANEALLQKSHTQKEATR